MEKYYISKKNNPKAKIAIGSIADEQTVKNEIESLLYHDIIYSKAINIIIKLNTEQGTPSHLRTVGIKELLVAIQQLNDIINTEFVVIEETIESKELRTVEYNKYYYERLQSNYVYETE